jgi:hypothetical protein
MLGDVLEMIPVAEQDESTMSPQEHLQANRLREIFLDHLGCLASQTGEGTHLLDPRFETLLEESDRQLAQELRRLGQQFHGTSPLASRVQSILRQLGAGGEMG